VPNPCPNARENRRPGGDPNARFLSDARGTALTGAWPSPPSLLTDDLRSLDAGVKRRGHERRSWPLSRTPKTGRFAGKNGQGIPRSSPFGGSHALVWLLQTAPSTATTGAWPFAHHHGGTNREGCRPKGGPRSASWLPSWLPGSGLFTGEKVWGPSFTQDSSLIEPAYAASEKPRDRRTTYLCPTQPPTPAQPS
jgi:hypothetical protein